MGGYLRLPWLGQNVCPWAYLPCRHTQNSSCLLRGGLVELCLLGGRKDGILLKARLKAVFLLSWGTAKLFSRKTLEVCGAEVKPSQVLWNGGNGE